jgi:hypothetical protein
MSLVLRLLTLGSSVSSSRFRFGVDRRLDGDARAGLVAARMLALTTLSSPVSPSLARRALLAAICSSRSRSLQNGRR